MMDKCLKLKWFHKFGNLIDKIKNIHELSSIKMVEPVNKSC